MEAIIVHGDPLEIASLFWAMQRDKPERDIALGLEAILGRLVSSRDGLLFDGTPLLEGARQYLIVTLVDLLEKTRMEMRQKSSPARCWSTERGKGWNGWTPIPPPSY